MGKPWHHVWEDSWGWNYRKLGSYNHTQYGNQSEEIQEGLSLLNCIEGFDSNTVLAHIPQQVSWTPSNTMNCSVESPKQDRDRMAGHKDLGFPGVFPDWSNTKSSRKPTFHLPENYCVKKSMTTTSEFKLSLGHWMHPGCRELSFKTQSNPIGWV